MLPTARPSPIPALRPAGEIKVRKRRENRSSTSTSSTSMARSSICSEEESTKTTINSAQEPTLSFAQPACPSLRRRKSSKGRVLSRVLGSIQASRSNPALQPARNTRSDGSIFRKLSLRARPSFPSGSQSPDFPSTSSILTSSSSRTTLGPGHVPLGRQPSNVTRQQSSGQVIGHTSSPPRESAYGPPPILTIDLNVVPECAALSLHEERCVWVAVEARGVVKADARDLGGNVRAGVGLDVVLVLDNSRFASPNSVQTACEVAIRIAQISADSKDDRLAVFCNHCCHLSDQATAASVCLLHSLKMPNVASLRRDVAAIRASDAAPHAINKDIHDTLLAAIGALTEPTENADQQPLRLDRCLIFVLSPRPLSPPDMYDQLSQSNVYPVCTAVIPYHSPLSEDHFAWILPKRSPLGPLSHQNPINDATNLLAQASDAISYARAGRSVGAITDLSFHIQPRQGCVVESILGDTSCTKLMAGHTVSALVRVKIPVAIPRENHCRSSPLTELDDAFQELECMLGQTTTEVLSVTARYKQSCFPENNSVMVEQLCTIRRPNQLSEWAIGLPMADSQIASEIEADLYRRFVFLIATQDPARIALEALDTFSLTEDSSLPCSDYIRQVREELIYQLQITTSGADGPEATTLTVSNSDLLTSRHPRKLHVSKHEEHKVCADQRHFQSHSHFSLNARDALSLTTSHPSVPQHTQRSSSALPFVESQRSSPPAQSRIQDSPGTRNTWTAQSGKCTPTSDEADASSVDEARAIWRHMRRNLSIRAGSPSRGTPSWPTGYRRTDQRMDMAREDREHELKQKALENKRSIGADTLRSLVMSNEANAPDFATASWLL